MKNLCVPQVLLFCLVFSSCSTKFKLDAPYKNITVVYALLDQADTAHYVRIQKAFLGQNLNSLTMAQTPDSNFYDSLNVRIKRFDFSGNFIDSFLLTRVNMDQEGYTKPSGTFFTAPNYAYKFKNYLNANYIYRILITNPSSGETDSAATPIIDDLSDSLFQVPFIDYTSGEQLDFASTVLTQAVQFIVNYTSPSNYNFENQQSPVAIAQGIFRFHWIDSNHITSTQTPDSADYNFGFTNVQGNSAKYEVKDLDFYYGLADGMGPAPANTFRLLDRGELFIYLSTPDYFTYYQESLQQGNGLTGTEIQPLNTNVMGANALGLFTSKGMRHGKITITYNTLDSLEAFPFFTKLNLVGSVYH